jgi:hypothetical protein
MEGRAALTSLPVRLLAETQILLPVRLPAAILTRWSPLPFSAGALPGGSRFVGAGR